MIKIKRISALFLMFSLFFCFGIDSFAAQRKLPDNFRGLSVEQRIQWLDEHIPQTTEDATSVSKRRIDILDCTSTKKNYYTDEINTKVVGISVTYDWTVDSNFIVQSYGISDFSPIVYDGSFVFIDKDVSSFYVNNSNVKICPEATFASAYMGVLVGQNVNLHGSGKISYSGVSQAY